MDWMIFAGVTLAAALIVALVARLVAMRLGRSGGETGMGPMLIAILVSLAVLQLASRLAVAIDWLYARAGIDAEAALGGQFFILAFAASFVPIAAYVLTFLVVVRKVRRTA